MNYNTVYVEMDVHNESFSLCVYIIETEKGFHYQRTDDGYKKVLNYPEFLRLYYFWLLMIWFQGGIMVKSKKC